MTRDIDALEACERPHPNIVKLRQQKRVDKMPSFDCKFGIVDRFLRDLQSRRTRAQESPAAPPIKLRFSLARTRHEIRQVKSKQVMPFDHIRITLFNESGQAPQRISLRFFN